MDAAGNESQCTFDVTVETEIEFILTFWFGLDDQDGWLEDDNTLIAFNFYECQIIEGSVERDLNQSVFPRCVVNTNRLFNPDIDGDGKGDYVELSLLRDRKYIIELIPILALSMYGDVRSTEYMECYWDRERNFEDGRIFETKEYINEQDTVPYADTVIFSLDTGRTINGTIKDQGSNEAIEDIKVKVFEKDTNGQVTLARRYALSGGSGYIIRGLLPGKYYVYACGDSKGYVNKFYDAANSFDDAQLVDVSLDDAENINFTLEQGKSVTGKLVDLSDINNPKPKSGACFPEFI